MTEHYELTNVPCQGEKCAVAPKVGFGEPIRIPPRPFSVIAGLISTAASLIGTQDRWLSEPRLPRGRAIRASTVSRPERPARAPPGISPPLRRRSEPLAPVGGHLPASCVSLEVAPWRTWRSAAPPPPPPLPSLSAVIGGGTSVVRAFPLLVRAGPAHPPRV